jgi:caffeoyl-CoA O-methyltransferase
MMKWMTSVVASVAVLLTAAHFAAAQPPGRPGGPPRGRGQFNPLLRLFDTDRDGSLSAAEIDALAAKLKGLDKSNDGKVSDEELRGLFASSGRGPARGPGGSRPARRSGSVSEGDFDTITLPQDDAEKKILAALDAIRAGERFRNVSPTDGRLLRLLVETIGAKRIVEIGTSTGESAVCMAMGLRKTGGHLYTHEIDADRAKIAQENFKKAGVDHLITLVLGDAHETVTRYQEPIDILFLDADKEGYIDYLNKLVPRIRPGGLIIAHNMNTRQADPQYLEAITKNPEFETLILLRDGTGVGVTLKKR